MKLILKIKLLPTKEQSDLLTNTINEANSACDAISEIAWEKRIFNNFKLHHEAYYYCKNKFKLSSQIIIRCISKVADSYKLKKNNRHCFNPQGGISYDNRVIAYKPNDIVSIWVIGGRIKIPFVCHNRNYLPYIKGEADLVFKNGKFYLFQTIDVPDSDIDNVEEFIGVDFGLIDIAVTSDGQKYSAESLNKYREKRQKVRSSLQSKGTKGCKRLLKRLSGREKTTITIKNHTISKEIVASAKKQRKGVAIEDLTGIRLSCKKSSKKFRANIHKWSFGQLRSFLTYKSLVSGVPIVFVNPSYTSKTCHTCKHVGDRKGKSFHCRNCGSNTDADFNASKNIATLGDAINHPENSTMYCSLHTSLGLISN